MKSIQNHIPRLIGLLIISMFAVQACALTIKPELTENTDAAIVATPVIQSETVQTSPTVESPEPIVSEETAPSVEEETLTDVTIGLTDAEIDSLIFMREEEKLAQDVYLALYDLWGQAIFQNIAGSEETHTDAVKQLLDTYNLPDPADTSPAGVFENSQLQTLYDDLIALGTQSLGDALKVGAAIEEIDILDLEEALTTIETDAIRRVYENLLRGSENHLRAFTSSLLRTTGEVYQPQYMDADAYSAIIDAENTRGTRGNNRRGGGN
jgi:hypothetical protein